MKRTFWLLLIPALAVALQGCARDNTVLLEDPEGTTAVQFTLDGRYLVTSSFNGISIWDLGTRKKQWAFGGFYYGGEVDSISLSSDGKYLLSSHRYGLPSMWSMDTKKLLRTVGDKEGIRLVRFAPNSSRFITYIENTLRMWTFEGTPLWEKQLPNGQLTVAFSPDGRQIACGEERDGTITILDAASGVAIGELHYHSEPVASLAYSPDGSILASGGVDTVICLWDMNSGHPIRFLKGHVATVDALAFSPDGALLASGSLDCSAALWSVRSGKPMRAWSGKKGYVNAVCFSPDGKLIAAGHDEGVQLLKVPEMDGI